MRANTWFSGGKRGGGCDNRRGIIRTFSGFPDLDSTGFLQCTGVEGMFSAAGIREIAYENAAISRWEHL